MDSPLETKTPVVKIKKKRKGSNRLVSVLLFLFFVILAIITLIPFYAMLLASFKPATELFRYGLNLRLDFNIMNFKNYLPLFNDDSILYIDWYKNSVLITLISTVLSLLLSAMVGYGLAKYKFKGRNLIFILVLFIMMVPVEILILPLYKLTVSMHIINTYAGIILPFAISPSAVFFFRQYAEGIPKDFMDAARIDGCSEYGIFFRVMAPLMKPAFGAMIILISVGSWNNFLWPLIEMREGSKFTLPVGLMSLLTPYGNNYAAVLSGSVLSVLPIIIIFLANQESFISGLTVGGVKG
ncbi:carbohydrate ABC transporter permease [Clostridium neuense]|uniref:Carbohydrate ABC transporter permease n=1 Tax=Clostridium neuense TaxID=1728934 RepID=A0ABW8TD96_9CLOT